MFDLKMFISFGLAMIAVKLISEFFLDRGISAVKESLELK